MGSLKLRREQQYWETRTVSKKSGKKRRLQCLKTEDKQLNLKVGEFFPPRGEGNGISKFTKELKSVLGGGET